jgi:hypothetical protein
VFKATGIFTLDQNGIYSHFFTACDVAGTGEATKLDCSESQINNSPEYDSSTNSENSVILDARKI